MLIDYCERKIKNYFEMWITNDFSDLNGIFATNSTYQEANGSCYISLTEIEQWINSKKNTQTILKLDIKDIWPSIESTFFVIWNVTVRDSCLRNYDGVSMIKFDEDFLICSIKEYQGNSKYDFPYHYKMEEKNV